MTVIDIKNLQNRRKALGLSKYKVAKLTGLSRPTIIYAERGENITIKTYNTLINLYTRLEEYQYAKH